MKIDKDTYRLEENNYFPIKTIKKQIIIANTFNSEMKHVIGWKNRFNGKNKKTAHYTISESGEIYEHFNSEYQSNYFKDKSLNSKSIIILIENLGWLEKDENNQYITIHGDIYNNPDNVITKKWREHEFWVKYTDNQLEATLELVKQLTDEFFIPKTIFSHNTKIEDLHDYQGILYKSNLEKFYTDLTPVWDYKKFKQKLEKN